VGRANKESTQAGNQMISRAQIGRPLTGSIEDQELLFDENGLGDDRTDSARAHEQGERSDDMNEKMTSISFQ
jgi:hypothetical protein